MEPTLQQYIAKAAAGDRAWNASMAGKTFAGISTGGGSSGNRWGSRRGGGTVFYYPSASVVLARMEAERKAYEAANPPPPPPPPPPPKVPFNWSKENFEQQASLLREGVGRKALLKEGQDFTPEEQRSILMGKDIGRPVQFATKEDIESLISEKRKEFGLPDPNAPKPTPPPAPARPVTPPRAPTQYELDLKANWEKQQQESIARENARRGEQDAAIEQYWKSSTPEGMSTPQWRNLPEEVRAAYDPEYGAPSEGPWGWYGGGKRGMGGLSGTKDIGESAFARKMLEGKSWGLERSWDYAQGYSGPQQQRMESGDWMKAAAAARAERSFLAGEAAKERAYDQAVADVEFAKELAAKKTAPGAMAEEAIAKGSGAQAGIAGGSQAGRTLAGEFKSQYETGSVLPASWMKNIDTEETATKVSGLVGPRTGAYQATYQGGIRGRGVTQVKPGEYAGPGAQQFSRSAVQKLAPTRTGLGR